MIQYKAFNHTKSFNNKQKFKGDAMRKSANILVTTAGATAFVWGSLVIAPMQVANAADAKAIEEGKELAFHRQKGNCLACHKIADGSLPGPVRRGD